MRRLRRGSMANSKSFATMKRLFNIMMFVAVAAMGITACQNEPTEINVNAKKVTIEVIGELDATRSSFGDFVENGDADYYPSKWDGGEEVVFSLNEAPLVTAKNTGTGSKATFSVGLTDDETTEGTIYAFSPKGNYSTGKGGFTSINTDYQDLYVVVPTEQNPSTTSVDPEAHLLAGKATYDNGLPSSIKMAFDHAAAYGRMEITNFAEEITKVKITASAPLAGTSCYYYYAGEKMGQLTNADEETITINNPAADNKVFWFGCAPADLSEGTLEVKVYTADASYTKSIDFASKDLELGFAFVQGQVANFRVSMSGVAKDVVDETSYALVTSLADIEDGLYIIAGYNSTSAKYFALPAAAKDNGRIAGTQVTVTDNKVSGVDAEGKVWTITKTGDYYTITAGELYFDYGESSTSLKVAEADSNNTWAITVGNTENTFNLVPQSASDRVLLFRTTNETNTNYDQFGAYSSGNATNAEYIAINLFKYGGTYKAALAAPVVTATADGNSITVSWGTVDGAANYTVSCDGFEDKTVSGTSVTYTELEYSTMYNFSVVANPTDTENNTASNPGTASAKTEADPNAEAPTSGYKLITSLAELTTGEYVIAAKVGSTYYAMPTTISSKIDGTEVTVTDNLIAESDATGKIWTVTRTGDNITIFNGTAYLKYSSSTNLGSNGTSAYNWAVEYKTGGNGAGFEVISTATTSRGCIYRSSSSYNCFGGYATSNYSTTGEYYRIQFFKKTDDVGGGDEPDTPVQLTAPTNLSATATTNTATVTWTAVANASSYDVTVGITKKNVTTTTATFDGLTPDITYNVSVVAVGDGTNYTNSTEATTTVKTLAESGGGDVTTTTATITFSDLGYTGTTNMWELSPAAIEIDANTSVTFFKGTNQNGCKYYVSGSAVRCYGGAYFTVSSTKTIVKIELVYGSSDGSNAITTDCGTFDSPTWTGSSNSVKFTIGGSSGNRRIAGIKVTYEN